MYTFPLEIIFLILFNTEKHILFVDFAHLLIIKLRVV